MLSPPEQPGFVTSVARLYDAISAPALEATGPTFQVGLLVEPGAAEDPRTSDRALARRAGVRDGERLLDAGCGICGPAVHIAGAYPRVRIDAVTVSAVQVSMARERVAAAGLSERVRVYQQDYHHLVLEPGYDRALFFETLCYAYDLEGLFSGIRRLLRPGGWLYIKELLVEEGPLSPAQAEELHTMDRAWGAHASPRLSELIAAVQACGFVLERAQRLESISTHTFVGGFVELHPTEGLRLSALGRRFGRISPELPVYCGELLARAPSS